MKCVMFIPVEDFVPSSTETLLLPPVTALWLLVRGGLGFADLSFIGELPLS